MWHAGHAGKRLIKTWINEDHWVEVFGKCRENTVVLHVLLIKLLKSVITWKQLKG